MVGYGGVSSVLGACTVALGVYAVALPNYLRRLLSEYGTGVSIVICVFVPRTRGNMMILIG